MGKKLAPGLVSEVCPCICIYVRYCLAAAVHGVKPLVHLNVVNTDSPHPRVALQAFRQGSLPAVSGGARDSTQGSSASQADILPLSCGLPPSRYLPRSSLPIFCRQQQGALQHTVPELLYRTSNTFY